MLPRQEPGTNIIFILELQETSINFINISRHIIYSIFFQLKKKHIQLKTKTNFSKGLLVKERSPGAFVQTPSEVVPYHPVGHTFNAVQTFLPRPQKQTLAVWKGGRPGMSKLAKQLTILFTQ